MAKSYKVVMGDEVMYGPVPESKQDEVQAFVTKLAPAIRQRCKILAFDDASPAKLPEDQSKQADVQKPVEAVRTGVASAVTTVSNASKAPGTKPASVGVDDKALNDRFASFLDGSGNSGLWKPKDGRNFIRILPIGGVHPTDWKTPFPFLLAGFHSKVGLSMQDTVVCPRLTFNKACPICQFVFNLYKSNDPNDKELAKNMRSYQRVLANIIDLNDVEKGVQKFGFGKKLAEKIMTYMNDDEFKPLLDPDRGHNFIVVKKIADGYPNYDDSRPEVKTSSITQIYPNWKEDAYDLKSDIVEKDWDALLAILEDTKKAIISTATEKPIAYRPSSSSSQAVASQASVDEVPQVGFKETPSEHVSEVSLEQLSGMLKNVQGQ